VEDVKIFALLFNDLTSQDARVRWQSSIVNWISWDWSHHQRLSMVTGAYV